MQAKHNMHPKVMAVLIVCCALIATTFVYAEKNTLFGTGDSSQSTVGVDNSSTSLETQSDPLAGLQVQSATGTVTIVQPSVLSNVGSSGATSSADTLTAKVSEDMFARLTADQEQGVTIDDTEANNIADQSVLDNAPASTARQYSITDLNVTNDTSEGSKAAYLKAIVQSLQNNASNSIQDVPSAFNTAVSSQDDTALAPLGVALKTYQRLIQDSLNISVPADTVGNQVLYLDTLSDIVYDIQNMQQIFTDPILGYVGFADYRTDQVKLSAVFGLIRTYVAQ